MMTPFKTPPLAVALMAALALAAPVAAQEAPSDDQAQTADPSTAPDASSDATPDASAPSTSGTEGEAPADESGTGSSALDMGEPVAGTAPEPTEPQVGQTYVREEFGDWSLRCLKAEEGDDPCQLYQLLLDTDGNAVAEISMFPLPPGGQAAAGATIVAPLETLLTEQLTLSVDGTAARRYPFTFCNRAGCVARVGFTADEVSQFKRGRSAELSVVPAAAPDQRVVLNISLSGFTAGFESGGPRAPSSSSN